MLLSIDQILGSHSIAGMSSATPLKQRHREMRMAVDESGSNHHAFGVYLSVGLARSFDFLNGHM